MYTNRPLRIALIDDDPQMLEMLKDFFIAKFPLAQLSTYKTGEDGLRSIFAEPDIIILDYHLDSIDKNAMNGLDVLRQLKEKFRKVPVIFLSGQEKAEIAANTMKFGAFDYLVKNEHAFARLEILINNVLRHSDLQKNFGTQRFFNRLLGLIAIGLVIGIIINLFSK